MEDWDITFIDYLKTLTAVNTLCSNRVFHLEVFQKIPSKSQFPCIVYNISSDVPQKEQSGQIDFRTAQVTLVVITEDSETLKTIRKDIDYLATETFDDALLDDDTNVLTIDIDDDAEDNIFAQEMQEKGYRTSTLAVFIMHKGK
jgi:hypothetical protein